MGLYTKTKTMMKNNLITLLDQTYPGVNALFDSPVREDGTQKWVDFAASFWHIDYVRGMSQTAFSERYRKWCRRHGYNFSSDKVVKIYGKAQDQIAMMPKDALTKLLVKQAIDALNAVSATLERLKAEMLQLASQLPEFITPFQADASVAAFLLYSFYPLHFSSFFRKFPLDFIFADFRGGGA